MLFDVNPSRFWAKVGVGSPANCWPWVGYTSHGYGRYYTERNRRAVSAYAHRLAYLLHYGVDPGSLFVRHKCDNRICCNPHHLELGTHADNTRDRVERGSIANYRRGERHGAAVLSDNQVIEIRRRYAAGELGSLSRACREFGISRTPFTRIVKGEAWKHVATMNGEG